MRELENMTGSTDYNLKRSNGINLEKQNFVANIKTKRNASSQDSNNSDANVKQPAGLAEMEGVTIVWTKQWLIVAYALILLISFVLTLQQQSSTVWRAYVTSSFNHHGLTGMTDVVSGLVSGVMKLPLAKFVDLVGRPQGFLVCLIVLVLALMLMAICQNVQTYAAAQVFYWAGMNGIDYVFTVFIADTSLLENRMIWVGLQGSPYIVNTFLGPFLGQAILEHPGWRWGYGVFAIATPVIAMSFWGIFWLMDRRAKQMGVTREKVKSNRTLRQSIWHWGVEFDVVGLVLVCAGMSIFLLPFSLVGYQKKGWGSPFFLCMVIFGLVIVTLFAVWERFYARKSFFPYYLMKDRTVIAACLLGANLWLAFYSYKMYYFSYLQGVFNLSVAKAGMITNIYFIVSCAWCVLIGIALKMTDRYKWAAIVAVPIQILMSGLLIQFRKPSTPVGTLIVVEIFAAKAGGVLSQIQLVAIMAAVPHEHLATGIALQAMITSIGGAIGQTISSAIWTQVVPKKIAEYLPVEDKFRAAEIYGSLSEVLKLPLHSPMREAVNRAYGDAQFWMMVVGTIALVPCVVWVGMLRNYRLSEHQHRRGLQA